MAHQTKGELLALPLTTTKCSMQLGSVANGKEHPTKRVQIDVENM